VDNGKINGKAPASHNVTLLAADQKYFGSATEKPNMPGFCYVCYGQSLAIC